VHVSLSPNSLVRVLSVLLFATSTTLFAQGPTYLASSSLPEEPAPQTAAPSSVQTTAQPPQDQHEDKKQKDQEAQQQLKAEEHQYVLGVVPNFNTVNGTALPLRPKQKFELALKSTVNPFQFVATGALAGLGQAQNSFPGYGQGFSGYAKRFGAGYADSFNGTIIGNAVLPVLLHQDPRYFRLGEGSIKSRVWYAIGTNFRCKGDNGKWQPNYSNVLGNFVAGGISNLYYPPSDRGVGLTFERASVVTAEGALGSLFVEFIPDVQRHVFHKKQPKPSE
jgi:hypothetical protein